jgi:hypothetical protein
MVNGNHVEAFARAFKGARLFGCAHVVVNAEPKAASTGGRFLAALGIYLQRLGAAFNHIG